VVQLRAACCAGLGATDRTKGLSDFIRSYLRVFNPLLNIDLCLSRETALTFA